MSTCLCKCLRKNLRNCTVEPPPDPMYSVVRNLEFTRKPGVSDLVSNLLESGKCNLKTLFNKLTAEDLMKPDVFKKDERIWPLGWEHICYLISIRYPGPPSFPHTLPSSGILKEYIYILHINTYKNIYVFIFRFICQVAF